MEKRHKKTTQGADPEKIKTKSSTRGGKRQPAVRNHIRGKHANNVFFHTALSLHLLSFIT